MKIYLQQKRLRRHLYLQYFPGQSVELDTLSSYYLLDN